MMSEKINFTQDVHSFSKPWEVVITHLDLDLTTDFEKKVLIGKARVYYKNNSNVDSIILDINELKISKIISDKGENCPFQIGKPVEYLGSPLAISIKNASQYIDIYYETSPSSEAVQWLTSEQTAEKKYPFLYTQSEAILARSWIPLQDSPGIRFTYNAKIKCPKELLPLMSATNPQQKNDSGIYTFEMKNPIPSYLMALAVGDIEFQSLGENCGVYAEPNMLKKCAWELSDLEEMVKAAEGLYGKYQWGRYDVIVLPPSFPFGGMENPRLTFATPTIIAADKSLVSLIAHELAHSWSGNLVTNATWNDFWLNEGFTVYFEQRIMEKLYGKEYSEMLTYLGYQELQNTIEEIGDTSADTHLYLSLAGRNPDDGMSDIAYEKGRFFLLTIENAVGREKWDEFLKNYFAKFSFQSMTTEKFLAYLDKELLSKNLEAKAKVHINDWVYSPGLPKNFEPIQSSEFNRVDKTIATFDEGKKISELDTSGYTTHHWVYFLRGIDQNVKPERLTELDNVFHFTKNNAEISFQWFILCIRNNNDAYDIPIKNFLTHVGRRKFVKPLFVELIKTEKGKQKAIAIYKEARRGYHAVTRNTIDELLADNK